MVLQVGSGLDLIVLMMLYFNCILNLYIRLLDFLRNLKLFERIGFLRSLQYVSWMNCYSYVFYC